MAYKDGLYWRQEQNDFMKIIFTGDSNTKQWVNAYRKVLPRLNKMAETVLRKYYGIMNEKPAQDLKNDAINHLILNGKYDPKKPNMFAYCGTIMKRYYYDKIVADKKKVGNNIIDTNYDINTDEWIADHKAIQPDFQYIKTEREEMFEEILKIIDAGIATINTVVIRNVNRNTKNKRAALRNRYGYLNINASLAKERELCFLHYAREYFVNNFMESVVSTLAMADFIDARCEIPTHTLAIFQNKYFGAGSQPERIEERDRKDWTTIRGKSYLMDDQCPIEGYHGRSRGMEMKKKLGDIDKYSYF